MLPDLTSLALFAHAVEMGSLTRAADSSCMSLAAASRRIAMLEGQLQTTLLKRTSRGVEPTEAGKALVVHAKEQLIGINRMQLAMSDYVHGRRGAVRILATTSAMTHYLPGDLAEFLQLEPQLRLSIGESWSDEIARQVMDHKVDVGVVVTGSRTHDLELLPYRSYRIGVVLRPDHALTSHVSPPYQAVLEHEIVALEGASLMMRTVLEQAAMAGLTLSLRVQVRSFEAVCRLVQAGLGVGLLPLEPSVGLAADMGLKVLPLSDEWAVRHMHVCCTRGHPHGSPVARLVRHLSQSRPA